MALPTTISAAAAPSYTWRQNPLLVSGSFYVFPKDSTTATILKAFKATDPTSSFTEQDSGNRPTTSYALGAIDAIASGTTIHIARVGLVGSYSNVQVSYVSYNVATDTWGANTSLIASGAGPNAVACSVGVRSDGDVLIAANAIADGIKGTPYDRVDVFRREVTSWTTNIDCTGNTGGEVKYTGPAAVMAGSDRFHIFFRRGSDNALLLGTYRSDNTWGQSGSSTPTPTAISGITLAAIDVPLGRPVFADGKVWVPCKASDGSLQVVSFTDGDNPASFTVETVSAAAVKANSLGAVLAALAVDGTTVHATWVRDSDSVLMRDSKTSGGAWGTDETDDTLTSVSVLSADIYDRSGKKLAFSWWDGSALTYDEISLAAAPAATSLLFPLLRPAMMSMLVR